MTGQTSYGTNCEQGSILYNNQRAVAQLLGIVIRCRTPETRQLLSSVLLITMCRLASKRSLQFLEPSKLVCVTRQLQLLSITVVEYPDGSHKPNDVDANWWALYNSCQPLCIVPAGSDPPNARPDQSSVPTGSCEHSSMLHCTY